MTSLMTPDISKKLGFSNVAIERFPTIDQVENATDIQICRWHRFLRSAETESEIEIQNKIYDKFTLKD